MPKSIPGYTYEDYRPLAPDYYLDRTAHWVRQWKANPRRKRSRRGQRAATR